MNNVFSAKKAEERGTSIMDLQLKTAKFGGYDKAAVESYIETLNSDHEKEVADLKANVLKLSETVKNLHTMREVNLNESSSTIDNLKKVNDELQLEVTQLREEVANFRNRDEESASRYESISRTLLEARENADSLMRETERKCEALRATTQEECDKLTSETNAECQRLADETQADCDRLNNETRSSCQAMTDSTNASCENLRRQAKEETDALREETERSCEELRQATENECQQMKEAARVEAYSTRVSVKKECESVSLFMSQLLESVENVVASVNETKTVADQAFPNL